MLVSSMFFEPMIFPVRRSSTLQEYQPSMSSLRSLATKGSGSSDGLGLGDGEDGWRALRSVPAPVGRSLVPEPASPHLAAAADSNGDPGSSRSDTRTSPIRMTRDGDQPQRGRLAAAAPVDPPVAGHQSFPTGCCGTLSAAPGCGVTSWVATLAQTFAP